MDGRAQAPAAGTVLNALATGVGSAFAIDAHTTARVELSPDPGVEGTVLDREVDPSLIERCVELTLKEYAEGRLGGSVETESEVPPAAGLKSSSAAANAAVLATLDALDLSLGPGPGRDAGTPGGEREAGGAPAPEREADTAVDEGTGTTDRNEGLVDPIEACLLGVRAARDVGVTVTGAFDDASASLFGGVTVTDNDRDELLVREPFDRHVAVWTPPATAHSADADVEACRRVAPIADLVADLALEGDVGLAMTVNGFAFCGALSYSTDPLLEALPAVDGVSLSGTGPSVVAVGSRDVVEHVQKTWDRREGEAWLTTTDLEGGRTI